MGRYCRCRCARLDISQHFLAFLGFHARRFGPPALYWSYRPHIFDDGRRRQAADAEVPRPPHCHVARRVAVTTPRRAFFPSGRPRARRPLYAILYARAPHKMLCLSSAERAASPIA